MSDSKITPVASTPVSGAVATPASRGGTSSGLSDALLSAASVTAAPDGLSNPAQALQLEGRVVASNPATGETRIATPAGDITVKTPNPLPPDTQVSVELYMKNRQMLANITLLRAENTRPAPPPQAAPPDTSNPVPPTTATAPPPQPPLKGGDTVTAIRIPPDTPAPEPQQRDNTALLARAAAIIEHLDIGDLPRLPQPLPLPAATLVKIATAQNVFQALQQLPPDQQQQVLDYIASRDVAAKIQDIIPPQLLARATSANLAQIIPPATAPAAQGQPPVAPTPASQATAASVAPPPPGSAPATGTQTTAAPPPAPAAENIDNNLLDIVKAQISAKLTQETLQQPAADAPTRPAVQPALSALRGLLPLFETLQAQTRGTPIAADPNAAQSMASTTLSGLPAANTQGNPFASQMPQNVYQLKIVSILPPGANAPALPVPAAAEGETPVMQATVESITKSGFPVLRAGDEVFVLKNTGPIAVGSTVTFDALALSGRDMMDALHPATGAGTPGKADNFLPLLSDDWPALQESLQTLNAAGADAAMRNTLPTPGARMVPTTLFFLAALRMGDIQAWLGESALQGLKQSGKQALVDRLTGDFGRIAAQSKETVSGDWRGISLPLLHDDQISQMQLFLRRHMPDDKDADKGTEDRGVTTRFLLNLHMSRMGDMQLDGLMHKKRFDLILRTADALPFNMRQDLMQGFAKGLAESGTEGGMSFQTKSQGWVTIDLPHQGTLA
ncbi:MAG: hypothetical protein PW788_15185 [Micavibrio sp.]|nr:hypothetical protein [Micavibrio sp.]